MTRVAHRLTLAFVGLLLIAGVVSLIGQLTVPPTGGQTRLAQVLYLLNPVVTTALGGYLIHVRPRLVLGWIVLFIATMGAVDSLAKAALNLELGSSQHGLRPWAGWLDNWTWAGLFGGVIMLLLLFPDGRLPSPRWRPAAQAIMIGIAVEAVLCALVPSNLDAPGVAPLVHGPVPEAFAGAGFFLLLAAILGALAALVTRWRAYQRAGNVVGIAQLRWLSLAAASVLVVLTLGTLVDQTTEPDQLLAQVWDVLSQLVFYGLPVSIGIAITRHGLFEIDRVVSRTVSYVVISGLLLGLYVGIVAGSSELLPGHLNSVAVVAATLAVSALFIPVRRAVQRRVDRRFNRDRYDRAQLVERFADRLRRDPTHGSDGADLLAVVQQSLQPVHAGLWLVRS